MYLKLPMEPSLQDVLFVTIEFLEEKMAAIPVGLHLLIYLLIFIPILLILKSKKGPLIFVILGYSFIFFIFFKVYQFG